MVCNFISNPYKLFEYTYCLIRFEIEWSHTYFWFIIENRFLNYFSLVKNTGFMMGKPQK